MGSDLPSASGMQVDANAFVRLGLSSWNSVVVPVVVVTPTVIRCMGTAFNISPDGVWITAGHVIDWALDVVAETADSYVAVLWMGSGADEDVPDLLGGAIPLNFYCRDNRSDLAVLRTNLLKNGEPYPWPHLRLTARMRKRATPIAGLGYTLFEIESDATVNDFRNVVVESHFHISTGHITENYPGGRDSSMLPSACFETSARFDAGMSGGPVLDTEGAACGVIASGMKQDGGTGYTSFASATPHIFMLELKDGDESMRVYEMVQRGFVQADSYFEKLALTEKDGVINVSFPVERD